MSRNNNAKGELGNLCRNCGRHGVVFMQGLCYECYHLDQYSIPRMGMLKSGSINLPIMECQTSPHELIIERTKRKFRS